jgi:hypothetical protein
VADPWERAYVVNIKNGEVFTGDPAFPESLKKVIWVLSAGPNGVVETPADSLSTSGDLVPGGDDALSRRAAESALRSTDAAMSGFVAVIGRSRIADDPMELHRAASEALLAANVAAPSHNADSVQPRLLSFEDTGAYRLLLPAMSEDPGELERFYSDTIAPLGAYDEQYGTELVRTLETFLASDGSMALTCKQLFTHRHTIRYRLERVRELTGLDVSSTDGRERLGLGLKAMRVLGIAAPRGPVFEPGAESGRAPQRPSDEVSARRG